MDIQWLNRIGHFTQRNSPAILSGAAIAGVVITAVLAVRATPRAQRAILEERDRMYADTDGATLEDRDKMANRNFTPMETVKVTWKHYVPAALAGAATIACIAGANTIGMQRNAALVAAYTLVDRQFREYKDHVLEELGENKERKVREKIIQKHVDEGPKPSAEVLLLGGGEQLCYETYTGRYFRSDAESIRRAENEVNYRILNDMCLSLNEWFDEIGLAHTEAGDAVGWNVDRRPKVSLSSHLTPDNVPCLAIGYVDNPFADFGKCF